MPTLTAATEPVSGCRRASTRPALARPGDRVGQRDVGAGDRRGAGAAVGLQHVAVQHDRVLAQRLRVDDGAQRCGRPAGRSRGCGRRSGPCTDSRSERVLVARGSIAYSAVTQPWPAALAPARHALGERRRAQHPGAAELDEHAALGVVEPAAGDRDRAELVGRCGRRRASGQAWRVDGTPIGACQRSGVAAASDQTSRRRPVGAASTRAVVRPRAAWASVTSGSFHGGRWVSDQPADAPAPRAACAGPASGQVQARGAGRRGRRRTPPRRAAGRRRGAAASSAGARVGVAGVGEGHAPSALDAGRP